MVDDLAEGLLVGEVGVQVVDRDLVVLLVRFRVVGEGVDVCVWGRVIGIYGTSIAFS